MVSMKFAVFFLAALPFTLSAPLRHANGLDLRKAHHRRACKTASATSASATATVASTTVKHLNVVETSSTKVATTKDATTSKTATASSASSTASQTPDNKVALLKIFPVSIQNAISSWSTSKLVAKPLPLNDATLNIVQGKNTQHNYVKAPDGTDAVEAFYAKGSISPGHTSSIGGFGLYSKGTTDLSAGKEVLFSYSAYFQEGFEFNKGGKMPGLYGGTDDEIARKCSGGRHSPKCWSMRMMWRANAQGELYAYMPQVASNDAALQGTEPKTVTNDAYGTSVARGSFKWATGAWTHVAQRVKLNDVGQKNGEVEIFINGVSVMKTTGLQYRDEDASRVRGGQIQTFFGGHEDDWASPKDQRCWFKDFSAAVIG